MIYQQNGFVDGNEALDPAVLPGTLNICMGRRSGTADLPLHHGRVPAWLHRRMSRLSVAMENQAVKMGEGMHGEREQ